MAKTTKAMRFFPKSSVLLVSWLLVMLNNADMAAAAPFHNPVNYSESSPRLQTAVYSERRPVLRKVPWNIYYAVLPSIHPGPHQMDSLSFSQKVCVFHCVLVYTKGESLLKTIHFIKSRINHNPWSYLQRCISIRVCTLESLRRKNCLWRTVMHGVSNMTPQQIAELHRVLAQALEIRLWKDILLFLQDKDFQIISNRYRNCSSARSSCMSQPNGSLFGNIIAGKPWSSDSGKGQFFRLVHIRYLRYKSGVFLAGKFQSEAKTKPTGIPSGRRFSVAGGNKPLNIVNNQKSSIAGYRKTADAAKNRWPADSSNRTERTFLIKQIFAAANNKASNITGNQQYSATLNMKTTRNQQPSSGQEPVSLTTNPQTMIVANYKAQDGVLNMIPSTTTAYKAAGVTTNQQYSVSSVRKTIRVTTILQSAVNVNNKALNDTINMSSASGDNNSTSVIANQHSSVRFNKKATSNQLLLVGDKTERSCYNNQKSSNKTRCKTTVNVTNQPSYAAGVTKVTGIINHRQFSAIGDNTPIGTFNNSKPFSQSYILSSTSRNQLLQSTGDNNENRLLTADKNTSNTTEENGDTLPDKSKFSKNESEGKSVTAIDSLSSKSTVTDNPVNIFSRSETEKPYSSSSTQFFNYLQSVSSKSNHSPDSKEKEQEEEKEKEEEEEEEEEEET